MSNRRDDPQRRRRRRIRGDRDETMQSLVTDVGPLAGSRSDRQRFGRFVARGTSPTETEASATPTFEQIFDTHYERLVRALTVVAGDRDTAADAVQDAFVKAHLKWGKISGYDDPAGWVRRVAINRLRNEHRSSTRKWRAVVRLGGQQRAVEPEPEIDEFGRLLAELAPQQRIATALYYVDGLTVAEIADTLEVSPGTVKSHLHDARRRLRPILANEARHD